MNAEPKAADREVTPGQPRRQRPWGRRMVISWLFFAVAFPLTFFVYGPIATPFIARAGSPWATPAEKQAVWAVVAVGDVLLLAMIVGILGVLFCGIGWYRARRKLAAG